jgi:flagella basal body P-ring formation protein FlgA
MAVRTLTALLILLLCAPTGSSAGSLEPLDAIRDAAEVHLGSLNLDQEGSAEITVGRLDPRLQLARCELPLEAFSPPGSRSVGNTTVGVRCSGADSWTIYVPAAVRVETGVLVATRHLHRGQVPEPGDFRIEERDIAALPGGYLTADTDLQASRLARSLRPGTVLTPSMLESLPVVKRGDTVTLLVKRGPLQIRASGKALSDAGDGARIRVRNLSSNKVVDGTVLGPRVVRIGPGS